MTIEQCMFQYRLNWSTKTGKNQALALRFKSTGTRWPSVAMVRAQCAIPLSIQNIFFSGQGIYHFRINVWQVLLNIGKYLPNYSVLLSRIFSEDWRRAVRHLRRGGP